MILFTVHRGEMAAALAAVIGAVERRNTIPILSNVLIRHDGSGTLALKATNLDIEIAATCPLAGEGAVTSFTVPAKTLDDLVNKLPDHVEITFEGDPAAQVTIRGGRSRFKLNTLPEADFPQMDGDALPHVLRLTTAELTGLFGPVRFAISTEETRYYLNGIFLHPRPDAGGRPGVAAVATDGHRLAFRWLAYTAGGAPAFTGVIVPPAAVVQAMTLAKARPDADPVEVQISESRIIFAFGPGGKGPRLASKLIDGSFPDYQRVIPAGNPNITRVSVKALAASLALVSTIAAERGRAVRMTFSEATLALEVVNPDAGQSADEVSVERQSGSDVEIGFNARYALDVMERMTTETADIALAEPGSPAVVTPTGDDTTLFVLMPMRV